MGKTVTNDIERYFEWWLNELKDAGYILGYTRESKTYDIFEPYFMERVVRLKTKENREHFALLPKIRYTPDYEIMWADKALYIFHQPADFSDYRVIQTMHYKDTTFVSSWDDQKKAFISVVDVKPPSNSARFSGALSSYHSFPIKQAVLLWFHGVFVNKIVPIPMSGAGKTISLFPNTFTPRRYMFTDGQTKTRTIRFRIVTMSEYISKRQKFVQDELKLSQSYRKAVSGKQTNLFNGK